MTDFRSLLQALSGSEVKFVIVGGVAATLHGSARLTQDVDVVYARDVENLDRIAQALAPFKPYLRGAPPGLPFRLDRATLAAGLNFALSTSLGDLDLLGEIVGAGDYEALLPRSIDVTIFGLRYKCIGLAALIAAKIAAGRPKDLEVIAELRALLQDDSAER